MSSRDSGIALESVATNKTIQYGGLGEYTWLDLLFKLYEWPSQTGRFTPERNSDYLRAFDKKTARKIKEFGNPIQKTKNAQQENPDAKMKNNYASRNLGE